MVKYNTFDVEKIKTFALESINFPFEAKRGTTMCVVGKLEDVKGHQRLLDTIKKLISNGIYAQLMIVGDGQLKYQLEEYTKSNSLEDYIHIVGFDINPYKLLSGGCLLIATEDGNGLVMELEKENIPAVIIGKATEGNDRVLINEEERRFLETTQTDEIYKVL